MSALKDKLRRDLTDAIRSKDELRTATIRMALTSVTNAEVAGKQARELSDEDVIAVLSREVKKRREAAQAYRDGGRLDRADREDAEAGVLAGYLPAQLTDEELDALVADAIAETGASSPRDMGAVMKTLQPKVAGRAEGARVAAAVKRELSGRTSS